jgi:hypothetical protein
MTNVIFTAEQFAEACARFKKKLATRQAAKEAVERIAAGAPRSSFGKFVLSFEEIEVMTGCELPKMIVHADTDYIAIGSNRSSGDGVGQSIVKRDGRRGRTEIEIEIFRL